MGTGPGHRPVPMELCDMGTGPAHLLVPAEPMSWGWVLVPGWGLCGDSNARLPPWTLNLQACREDRTHVQVSDIPSPGSDEETKKST